MAEAGKATEKIGIEEAKRLLITKAAEEAAMAEGWSRVQVLLAIAQSPIQDKRVWSFALLVVTTCQCVRFVLK